MYSFIKKHKMHANMISMPQWVICFLPYLHFACWFKQKQACEKSCLSLVLFPPLQFHANMHILFSSVCDQMWIWLPCDANQHTTQSQADKSIYKDTYACIFSWLDVTAINFCFADMTSFTCCSCLEWCVYKLILRRNSCVMLIRLKKAL